jgi:hypothetical protein
MRLLGAAAAVLFLAACDLPWAAPAGVGRGESGTGDATTVWLSLPAGEYVVQGTTGNPGGCVQSIELVGTNEYPVVMVYTAGMQQIGRRPNDPPPQSPKPDQEVVWVATLVAGTYRFEVTAPAACHWYVQLHPPVAGTQPDAPVAARCSDLSKSGAQFVRITGRRVPLPANNPLAGDQQVVQPLGDTIDHYAIGIDDGSAVCTVLWSVDQPQLGAVVSFTAEILTRNQRVYLGVVDP